MKCAVIFYHKNALQIYRREWINDCIYTIKNQTFKNFDVFELNYGGSEDRFGEGVFSNYIFIQKQMENHIEAMNYLYSMLFANGYDVVFNTNLDDFYSERRFEVQLSYIEQGYDIVSSDFKYVNERSEAYKDMVMTQKGGIAENLARNHNVIAHPCVAMSKSFWDDNLHYKNILGSEDLDLWKRGVVAGKKFFIIPEFLLFYRIHDTQVTKEFRSKKKVNLMVIATNKYRHFVAPLLDSADKYFLDDCDVEYCVFTDDITDMEKRLNRPCHIFEVKHQPWPYMTLHRFHVFRKYMNDMPTADYYAYIDADTLFKGIITKEILSNETVVQHCGFTNQRGPYETNPMSESFVPPQMGTHYFGGGFWLFSKERFPHIVNLAIQMIDTDAGRGIIPVWHDESVLNKLMVMSPPEKILPPAYHYPQSRTAHYIKKWGRNYECKILLLDKNHDEYRKEDEKPEVSVWLERYPFVTMSNFGSNGRLGNMMFQYAFLIGLSKKYNVDIKMPAFRNMPDTRPESMENVLPRKERSFHYTPQYYDEMNWQRSWDFSGYFQSEKYWSHCREAVISALAFNDGDHMGAVESMGNAFSRETIAIHIRRGDYVNNKNYYQLTARYYILALEENFPNWRDCNLVFFSDDIEYAMIHFECLDNAYFSEGHSEIEDMFLMSKCDNHIIANSTFSWWGAYLSKSKKVVCPANVFDTKMKVTHNTKDFYPEGWVKFSDEGKRINLQNLTFIIPVKFDHRDRIQNFEISTAMIRENFVAPIYVGEIAKVGTFFNKNCDVYTEFKMHNFHRTKMINDMVKKISTPFFVNYDCDVLLAPMQIMEAVRKLQQGSDMVSPYDWRFSRVPRAWEPALKKNTDVGIFSGHRNSFIGFREGDKESWGGAIFFNKESFIKGGMENENFISFGPEDSERLQRFSKLGFSVCRVRGPLYHLDHFKGIDSGKTHAFFQKNKAEFKKILALSAEDLRKYVDSWSWLKA
jgi:hypothetical protein